MSRDFHLFEHCTKHLMVMWFAVNVCTREALTSWLQTLGSDLFYATVQDLVSQWDKCWRVNGTYMEVWRVPPATLVLRVHHNQNKVLAIRVFVTLFLKTSLYTMIRIWKQVLRLHPSPHHLHSAFKLPHSAHFLSSPPAVQYTRILVQTSFINDKHSVFVDKG
jgi:hypothetical protein